VEALRERVEGVVYEWREQTVALRAPDDAEARLAAVLVLADGLRNIKGDLAMLPAS